MISEYKFFHGAVLAELVSLMQTPLSIDELQEEGRLSSYVLNGAVGLQIKHCANRLRPWRFTFTKSNLVELLELRRLHKKVFLVFVCNDDGFLTLTLNEATSILLSGESEQAWIRVDRRRNEWYSVSGGASELDGKKPQGLGPIVQELETAR